MGIIITLAAFWAVCKIISTKRQRAREKEVTKQFTQVTTEQAAMRREFLEEQARARKEERERLAMKHEQERLAEQAAKHEAQLTKQAAQIAKHDEQIAKLEFRMGQAEADMEHLKEHVGSLYALLDIAEAEQAGALPGSKTDIRCQNKIIALKSKIHSAERRLNKAQFDYELSQNKLEDAV